MESVFAVAAVRVTDKDVIKGVGLMGIKDLLTSRKRKLSMEALAHMFELMEWDENTNLGRETFAQIWN